jgi:hypothetical protein
MTDPLNRDTPQLDDDEEEGNEDSTIVEESDLE